MPTYEYRCPEGHEFEKFFRKISDAVAEMLCPQCGKPAERRISAGAGLVFKGSGFYITDYGKDGKKDQPSRPKSRGEGSGEGSSSGSGDAAGGGEAKPGTESKPAATEAKSAPAKESPKADAAPSKPSKPGKPSTE